MIPKRRTVSRRYGRVTAVLLCLCLSVLSTSSFADPASAWKSVDQRAKAIGTRKAIWRELKKLSPALLIESGEGVFLSGANREMDDGGAILANAILSYHSKKTSPDETAAAIAHALSTSNTQGWLEECIMWLENNDHFLDVSDAAMHKIAEAAIASILGQSEQTIAGREGVVAAIREDTFVLCLSDKDFQAVLNACKTVLADGSGIAASSEMRTLCQKYAEYAQEGETHRAEWKKHVRKLRERRAPDAEKGKPSQGAEHQPAPYPEPRESAAQKR